jgi:formyltetrahydrofolate hydrolase
MKLTQKMKITNWTYNQKRFVISIAFKWCKKNIESPDKIKKSLSYVVKKYEEDNVTYGQYSYTQNKIFVYYNNICSLKLLLRTMIHEYRHSIQPEISEYHIYHRKYGYRKNPLEIEARESEKAYFSKLYNHIKNTHK